MGTSPAGPVPLPPGIVLRTIPGDDPLIEKVHDLCYETLHAPFGVTRSDEWGDMDADSTHIVALDGARVVGYVRLLVEGDWGHVRQVAVAESHRRRGLGSALVGAAVALGRSTGLPHLYLNARLNAVGLYEKHGFRVVSPEPFPMPRTYLPHVRMELDAR
jgi:ribosomal protein S18 acetylase RimI-like enzyme